MMFLHVQDVSFSKLDAKELSPEDSEDFDPAPEAVLWVSPGVMAPKTVPLRPAPPAARYPES